MFDPNAPMGGDPAAGANPFMQTMAAPAAPMAAAPGADFMQQMLARQPTSGWGSPGMANPHLLALIQRMQAGNPNGMGQFLQHPWGGGMGQPRAPLPPHLSHGMTPQQPIPQRPQVMPGQMPLNPAAPVAPAGFAATPNPMPGVMY